MTLYISIQREARPTPGPRGSAKQRLRAAIRAEADGPVIFSGRVCGSVAAAKREAEQLFGPLSWSEANQAQLSAAPLAPIVEYFNRARPRADELLDVDERSELGRRLSGAADALAWVIGLITSPPRMDKLP
jgi:hypothetical protein